MFGIAISMFEPEHRAILRRGADSYISSVSLTETRRLREAKDFDRSRLRQMGDLGWLGLGSSDDPDIGLHEMVAVHRELGRGVLSEPVVATSVLPTIIVAGSSTPRSRQLVAKLLAGEEFASLAWQAAPGSLDASDIGVEAIKDESGWRLSGQAAYVPWANRVDHLLVAARTDSGVLIADISPAAAGVSVRQATAVDGSVFCNMSFENCHVDGSNLVLPESEGARLLDKALDTARLALSAEMIGLSEALFHTTLQYLKQRKQFGRTLGSNQALQFIAVDLFTQIELANSALRHASDKMISATDDTERTRAAIGCKIRANDVALLMAKQGIQLHGAIGYTDECDVSLFVKRAFTSAAWLGTSSALRKRLEALHPLARKTH